MSGPATSGPPAGDRSVIYLYPPDDRVARGGADLRVERLAQGVAKTWPTQLLRIGAGLDIDARPTVAARTYGMLRGIPPRLSQRFDASLRRRVASATRDADVIVLGTTFCAPLVPPTFLGRCVLDAHNLEWRVVEQLARQAPRTRRWAYARSVRWTRWYEARLARHVAGVWAVSPEESAWFTRAGARRVSVIPNGVDLPPLPPWPAAPSLIFVGSLASRFNRDGLDWFLAECWDPIRAAVPGVRLLVAGRGGQDIQGPGVEAFGFVDDLGDLYAQSSVAIVPLRHGAGTRLKVLEAMAHGRGVVATPVGAEGLQVDSGDGVVIASTGVDFVAACIRLLKSPDTARQTGSRGRRTAVERFDWRSIGMSAALTLSDVLG